MDREWESKGEESPGRARGFEDLIVWQKGISLVKEIYRLSKAFPDEERFGLTSQVRRAAVSIPSNIAEGQARRSTREFVQFIGHAEGSVAELNTHLIIAVELGYLTAADSESAFSLKSEVRRMLNALRRSLTSGGRQA